MTVSTSKVAYEDCFDFFDQALDDEKGIRVRIPTMNDAIRLRMRMNYARRLDRDDNRLVFEPGDPLYGKSIYDRLTFRICTDIKTRTIWVHIDKIKNTVMAVESLSDVSADGDGVEKIED